MKVVQRIPVKIRLESPWPEDKPLRLGMSVIATIDTRDRSGPLLLTPQASRGFQRQESSTIVTGLN